MGGALHTHGWRKRLLMVQTNPACCSGDDWELLSLRRASIPAPDKRPKPRGERAPPMGSSSAPASLHSSSPSSLPPSQPAAHSLHYKELERGCGISATSFIFFSQCRFSTQPCFLRVDFPPPKNTKKLQSTMTEQACGNSQRG